MAKEFAKAFYDSKKWAETRNYILNRDNAICVRCGKAAEEVHHIIRINAANVNDVTVTLNPDNLISLCRDCHQKEHYQERLDGRTNVDNTGKFVPKSEMVFDSNGQLIDAPPPVPI